MFADEIAAHICTWMARLDLHHDLLRLAQTSRQWCRVACKQYWARLIIRTNGSGLRRARHLVQHFQNRRRVSGLLPHSTWIASLELHIVFDCSQYPSVHVENTLAGHAQTLEMLFYHVIHIKRLRIHLSHITWKDRAAYVSFVYGALHVLENVQHLYITQSATMDIQMLLGAEYVLRLDKMRLKTLDVQVTPCMLSSMNMDRLLGLQSRLESLTLPCAFGQPNGGYVDCMVRAKMSKLTKLHLFTEYISSVWNTIYDEDYDSLVDALKRLAAVATGLQSFTLDAPKHGRCFKVKMWDLLVALTAFPALDDITLHADAVCGWKTTLPAPMSFCRVKRLVLNGDKTMSPRLQDLASCSWPSLVMLEIAHSCTVAVVASILRNAPCLQSVVLHVADQGGDILQALGTFPRPLQVKLYLKQAKTDELVEVFQQRTCPRLQVRILFDGGDLYLY